MLDIRQPVPDAGHETLRQAVVQALDELQSQVQRINDTFLLLLTTADFAQSTLSTTISGQAAIARLSQAVPALDQQVAMLNARFDDANARCDEAANGVDALQARVAVLEQANATPATPDTAG